MGRGRQADNRSRPLAARETGDIIPPVLQPHDAAVVEKWRTVGERLAQAALREMDRRHQHALDQQKARAIPAHRGHGLVADCRTDVVRHLVTASAVHALGPQLAGCVDDRVERAESVKRTLLVRGSHRDASQKAQGWI